MNTEAVKLIICSLFLFTFVAVPTAQAGKKKYTVSAGQYQAITLANGKTAYCYRTNPNKAPEPGKIKQKRGKQYFVPTTKSDKKKIARLKNSLRRARGPQKAKLKRAFKKAKKDFSQKKRMCALGFDNPDQDPKIAFAPIKRDLTPEDMRLLLEKAAFGYGPEDQAILNAGVDRGIDAALNELFRVRSEHRAILAEVDDWLDGRLNNDDEDTRRNEFYGMRTGWLHLMLNTRNPYREKFALFLWTIWGSSEYSLGYNERDYMWDYISMVREAAYDNSLKNFVRRASVSPMILKWLDNGSNVKYKNNFQFASAFLNAFMLGEEAYRKGEFSDADIQKVAESFSGWQLVELEDADGEEVLRPFFVSSDHTPGSRTLFSGTPYSCSVQAEESVYDCLFDRHTGTARHYARSLLKFYLTDSPSEDLVQAFAAVIKDNNFNLHDSLRVLFKSELFFSDRFINSCTKNPIEIAVEWIRTLQIPIRIDDSYRGVRKQIDRMGMSLTSVKYPGWYNDKKFMSQNYFLSLSNLYASIYVNKSRFEEVNWTAQRILPVGEVFSQSVILHAADKLGISLTSDQVDQLKYYMDYEREWNGEITRELYDNVLDSHQAKKGLGLYMVLGLTPEFVLK